MNIKNMKQLRHEFDDKYMKTVLNLTDELYEISKDTKDYMYFKPFYIDIIKKLLKYHERAHNTNVRDSLIEVLTLMDEEYQEWKFLKNQYYKFINCKNEFTNEDEGNNDE